MNKDSFNKIINLDIDDLNDNIFIEALEYFLTIKDNKLKEEFLDKYKILIEKYLYLLLSKVDVYPIYDTDNQDVYRIDKFLFYIYSLYGYDEIKKLNINKNCNDISDNIYKECLQRYHSRVFFGLMDNFDTIKHLDLYVKERKIKAKYNAIDKNILEEAYYIYFSLDNFLDKENYKKRNEYFIKKNDISYNTLVDYARTYGLLYLNISLGEIEMMIRSIDITITRLAKKNILDYSLNCIMQNDDIDNIKEIVLSYQLSPYVIKQFINRETFYYKKYFKKLNSIINKVENAIKLLENEHKYVHYSVLFSKLEKTTDEKEIIEIIKNNDDKFLTTKYIDYFISIYRITLTKDDKDRLKSFLLNKIKKAKKTLKEEKEDNKVLIEERTLKSAFNNIDFKLFLNDNICNINDFCSLMNITRNEFNKYFTLLKDTDNELYLKINEKMRNLQGQRYAVLINKVNSIADNIINGIELEDGSRRNFEILDYFLATKLDFNEFIDLYNKNVNIDIEYLRAIRAFFAKNKLTNKLNINQELDGTTIFMINDKPYEVSKEEKQTVLNYLRVKDIPLYIKVYKQALKRHINGNLILDDDKKLIKKG